MFKVAAFYRFVPLEDRKALRQEIYDLSEKHPSLCGTILLAPEGINSTVGGHETDLDALISFLDKRAGITRGELKYSTSEDTPFNKFKVRLKKEIITLRREEANPNTIVGDYVDADGWNNLIADPDVVVLDTRNEYETRAGTFQRAIDPKLNVFTEFPDWVDKNLDPAKHKKIAMFCTGGIRCEKASAYMRLKGFENVYHLKGGILKYLEDVPEEKSRWDGQCFVFDKRVTIKHGLKEGDWTICHGCREPLSREDAQDPSYEKGVSCKYCINDLTTERADMLRQRQRQYEQSQKHG